MSRRRTPFFVFLWAMLVLLILGGSGPGAQFSGRSAARAPLVIAHRAGAAAAPENTLAALERAIAAGADIAEVDVRSTRDGVLVALHDETLARTAGLDRPVSDVDFDPLRRLDAGFWHSPAFAGEPIPTLDELLAAARGRIRLMVEVKEPHLAARAALQIQTAGMERQCLLASTDLTALQRSKEASPALETVCIAPAPPWSLETLDYVDGCSLSALTAATVAQVHACGKSVYAWTLNTSAALTRAAGLGVDGVVTDNPALAIALFRSP